MPALRAASWPGRKERAAEGETSAGAFGQKIGPGGKGRPPTATPPA